MNWYSEGVQTAPAANTILADTGALGSSGSRAFNLILNATIALGVTLEWRNSDNTANVQTQVLSIPAGQCVQYTGALAMDESQRLRVRTNAVTLGNVQASILAD